MRVAKSTNSKKVKSGVLRIESVDNWHESWDAVLKCIEKTGTRRKLQIDPDGWLSSRQVLMVAFVGETPVAHICFSVLPVKDGRIEAHLDTFGVDPRFRARGIESELHRKTVRRARNMGCGNLNGWALPPHFHEPRQRWAMPTLHL